MDLKQQSSQKNKKFSRRDGIKCDKTMSAKKPTNPVININSFSSDLDLCPSFLKNYTLDPNANKKGNRRGSF
jgi:hypothetical protein